jgi:GTP-binding protein Era
MGRKISIVSPKAQTTRNRITGVLTKDNCQYVFLDTPGMHKAKSGLGQAMVQSVGEGIESADITLFVVEAGDSIKSTERAIIKMLCDNKMTAFLLVNKIDEKSKEDVIKTINEFSSAFDFEEIIPISAVKYDGLDIVLEELKKRAEPSFFYYDEEYVTDTPKAMYITEVIREKMLYNLGLEIPHSVALISESFEEDDRIIRSSVTVYCSRETHKGIIIGKKGVMLKKILTDARVELENTFEKKVFLECFVKVKLDWQNSSAMLRMLGM